MKINKYPDGTSYVTIGNQETRFPKFTFRINSYDDLWKLGQLLEVCRFNNLEPTIVIPNLIDAQADRRFEDNQSSGLYLVSEFLNQFENTFYKIYHPHNPEVVEALFNSVEILDNSSFVDDVIYDIRKLNDNTSWELSKNLILMSSDAGGFKPLMKTCNKIRWRGETFSASKSRKYVDDKSSLSQFVDRLDFNGKDILIVDDISVYGGTFKGLSKLLRERNCGKLYLAVSHMTIQNLGIEPVTYYFDKVFTTNSKFDEYWLDTEGGAMFHPKNLKIFKTF